MVCGQQLVAVLLHGLLEHHLPCGSFLFFSDDVEAPPVRYGDFLEVVDVNSSCCSAYAGYVIVKPGMLGPSSEEAAGRFEALIVEGLAVGAGLLVLGVLRSFPGCLPARLRR